MRFAIQIWMLLLTSVTLVSALRVDKGNIFENREQPYDGPNIEHIKVEDKREELYPPDLGGFGVEDKNEEFHSPDLGRTRVEDKHEELYPWPDLRRINVEKK